MLKFLTLCYYQFYSKEVATLAATYLAVYLYYVAITLALYPSLKGFTTSYVDILMYFLCVCSLTLILANSVAIFVLAFQHKITVLVICTTTGVCSQLIQLNKSYISCSCKIIIGVVSLLFYSGQVS